MEFVHPAIQQYAETFTSAENLVLQQLNRDTHANVLQPRMLSGHLQGRLLSMLSCMVQPKTILEIGTYTGYSALCLAEGLSNGGKLITIDVNAEREEMVNEYIKQAGFENRIQHIIGDALRIIPTLKHTYDLIFIDADKPNYINYYHLAMQKLNPCGYIIIDNVLWSGKVIDPFDRAKDSDTELLHELNLLVHQDNRVENILLPIRDGLMVIRKLSS
jgi:caffeoyl-CoA O-methyltransferase